MNKENENLFKSTMTSGAVLGLGLILFSVLLYIFDLTAKAGISAISYIIIIVGIIYGTIHYRDNFQNGVITYARALGTGTLVVLFAGFLQACYSYILVTIIDPEFMDKLIEEQIIQYQERGMSDDEIESTLAFTEIFRNPVVMSIFAFFGSVSMGFIISLITSIFLKREGDGFEQAMNEIKEN